VSGREKVSYHPRLSQTDIGLEFLKKAHDAAQSGNRLSLDFAMGRARIFLTPDEIEELRMEHRLCFLLMPELSDGSRAQSTRRTQHGFADFTA